MDRLNIKELNRKRSNYKNLGPWIIYKFDKTFESDFNLLPSILQDKVNKILDDLILHPYQGKFKQHPLWQFIDKADEYVVWSAIIDKDNRLTYLIHKDKNEIYAINCYGHQVGQFNYSNPEE